MAMLNRPGSHHKLIILTVLVVAALTPFVMPLEKHRESTTIDFASKVPSQVGSWQRVRAGVPQGVGDEEFINEIYQGLFFDSARGYILLTLEYSSDSRRKYELHFPAICQAARGDEVIEYPAETMLLSDGSTQPVAFLSWLEPDKKEGALCVYWYVVGGEATNNTIRLKVKQFFAGLLHKPERSIMVRVDALYDKGVSGSAREEKRRDLQMFVAAFHEQLTDQSRSLLYGN